MKRWSLEECLLTQVTKSTRRITPAALRNHIRKRWPQVHGKEFKATLNRLVAEAKIQYIYEYGASYLVPGINRPVALSPRIYIKPLGSIFCPPAGQVAISLSGGAAFGNGSHPTTIICLRILDWVMQKFTVPGSGDRVGWRVLDIGTGSGILAIAAVKLGAYHATGTDIEAISRKEARENCHYNQVADRIAIVETPFQNLTDPFNLIMANLRTPTLLSLYPHMVEKCGQGSVLIISGMRSGEEQNLLAVIAESNFRRCKQENHLGWTGFVAVRV